MKDIAVKIENLTKSYKMYENNHSRLKEAIHPFKKKYHEEFFAIKNVSFDVVKGQTVGILGKNGSGKSTLLKMITGVLNPTKGNIQVNGEIGALLELGAGFNPEYTGIENIYLYGTILGYDRKQVDAKLNSILEFAEIGEFVYQKVKSYSSGMFVRLAFATAICFEPDILIVDEALSVGDMYFQLKCINKIKELRNEGKTILFVTHDIYTVRNICDYAIWLQEGEVRLTGDVETVVDAYEKYMKDISSKNEVVIENEVEGENKYLNIQDVKILSCTDRVVRELNVHDNFKICISYNVLQNIEKLVGGISIFDSLGNCVCGVNTKLDEYNIKYNVGNNQLILEYKNMNLLPGVYYVDAGFFEDSGIARLDYKTKITSFEVKSNRYLGNGVVLFEREWRSIN